MTDEEIWTTARSCGLMTKQPGSQALDEALLSFARLVIAYEEVDVDMLKESAAEAQAQVDNLKQHLRAALEICRVWEPNYATGMDRQTLVFAAEAARGA